MAAFGSVTAAMMVTSRCIEGSFSAPEVVPVSPLDLHPAAHVLHYGSSCFEGLKAHRGADGTVRLFRAADHAERLRRSAARLCLPVPETQLLTRAICDVVVANRDEVPDAPGALYIRPALIGTDPNIGAAATPASEALLFVLASPVGDYFGHADALTLRVETELPRTTPQFGEVKTGANYAMALGITLAARAEGADQVLFAPGGDVQETGASNFLLLDDDRVVTKALGPSFLHGVTRASVLTMAADLGYLIEERDVHIDEALEWARHGEAALVGTAAVLAGVGALIHEGQTHPVGPGTTGPNTLRLRTALLALQRGESPDRWGWTRPAP